MKRLADLDSLLFDALVTLPIGKLSSLPCPPPPTPPPNRSPKALKVLSFDEFQLQPQGALFVVLTALPQLSTQCQKEASLPRQDTV